MAAACDAMNRRFARGWAHQLATLGTLDNNPHPWNPEFCYRQPSVVSCASGQGSVLLDLAANRYINLNAVGALLWDALQSHHHLDDLADMMNRRYPNVPRDVITADVENFLGSLQQQGLLTDHLHGPTAFEASSPQRVTDHHANKMAYVVACLIAPLAVIAALVMLRVVPLLSVLRYLRAIRRMRPPTRRDPNLVRTIVTLTRPSGILRSESIMCLETSLAAAFVCAVLRQRVEWCIGAVREPFGAHAWIAVKDQPIDDRRAVNCDLLFAA